MIVGVEFAGSYVARKLGRRGGPHADLVLGRALAHDPESRRVQVQTEEQPFWLQYENLVVALGAFARTLPIPGLAEHALGFKSLADAIHLRNHVLTRLEVAASASADAHRRRELTFVFVGAGYAGVEALAELADLVRDAPRYYPALRQVPQHWVLVVAAPKILPEIPTKLGDYVGELLRRRGVDIRVETTLEEVEPHAVRFQVDETLRVDGTSHVRALGDGAAVPNAATPGQVDPPTSKHAMRQARRLAKNLAGDVRGYRYGMLGEVATLGRQKGIASVFGFPFKGFGWWITRTYHLYQLPLASRKLRVVADWTVALFFRRDVAELSLLEQPRRLGG